MKTSPSDFEPAKLGWRFLFHLPQFARLFWRLFRDRRVSIWAKSVLVLAFVYVASPFDLIPDFSWILGQTDDLAVVFLACRTFLSMCPKTVVAEHVRQIGGSA